MIFYALKRKEAIDILFTRQDLTKAHKNLVMCPQTNCVIL